MSSAQKTPSISVSSTRNAIMYSLTRFSIDTQLARMQSGIRNVVRMTNSIEMPSTPILYFSGPEPGVLFDELEACRCSYRS